MKTIKLKTTPRFAEQVGILLFTLEMAVIATWSEEDFTSVTIFIIAKLDEDKSGLTPELRIEKLKEKSFIKII
jgi:hypothetical protein